jgi:hypothetical protein
MQSVNAMKSMDEPCTHPQRTRSSSRFWALVCAGLQATVAGCSEAAPSASAPTPLPLAAASPVAASRSSFDAPWLTNVPSARRPATGPMPCPARVPEALNPPADATLELAWPASGVQIYACTQAKSSDAPSWSLEGPHALLMSGKAVAAIHFAGPIWQGVDGSQVKGARLAAADAPDASAVPWLLMSASASGKGTFAHTTHIQRLDTAGGKAPASGCDAAHLGAKVLVPYQANYFFYRHAKGGEAVRQCRSGAAKPLESAQP